MDDRLAFYIGSDNYVMRDQIMGGYGLH
jgi:hypothetical protein